jgi:hypothetical protein
MRFSVLASVALLLLGAFLFIEGASVFGHRVPPGELAAWYGGIGIGIVGAAVFAARDPYGFAGFAAIASGLGLGAFWLAASVMPVASFVAVVVTAACAIGLCAGIGFVTWTTVTKDPIPNVLRQHAAASAISEVKGVQILYRANAVLPTDTIAPYEVFLQNCTDAPRTVELALTEAPLLPAKPSLLSRAPGAIALGPSEVKLVRFPVTAAAGAKGEVRTHVRVRVSGSGGRRTRRWRARPHEAPLSLLAIALFVVFLLPLGMTLVFVRRGGLVLRLVPTGAARAASELPAPGEETLWREGAPSPSAESRRGADEGLSHEARVASDA